MAEAKSIASLAHTGAPITLGLTDEGLRVSFVVPTPRRAWRATRLYSIRVWNWFKYSLFPFSGPVVLALTAIAVGWIAIAPPDSWVRTGWLAHLVWTISAYFPWLDVDLNTKLLLLAAWTGLVITILLATVQRLLIRALLSYKGYLYHARKPTLTVKLWFILMRLLVGGRKDASGLYAFQGVLPSLPVPGLKETTERYLDAVRAHRTDKEFAETKALADDFLATSGPKLQRYLVLKSWYSSNYVTDWWEKYVYLHGRDPIMINSNYYAMDGAGGIPSSIQEARGALIVFHMIKYCVALNNESLPPTCMAGGVVPLCMDQFRRLFATTRVPGREVDRLKHWDGPDQASHVAVLCNGSWYKLPVFRADSTQVLPHELEAQLAAIKRDATSRTVDEFEAAIPALTAGNRTRWAEVRETYFREGLNRRSLHMIESALFHVHLDLETEDVDSWTGRARGLMHGNGCTRWFDKSFTLILFKNGRSGLNAEHSFADAPVVAHLFEMSMIIAEKVDAGRYDETGHLKVTPLAKGCSARAPVPKWSRVAWALPRPAEAAIAQAVDSAHELIQDLDLQVVAFEGYGKGFMKRCRVSPDAYIQMAMQLAYFKDHGKFNATYEASMTRLFKHGRTETVRPVTPESAKFVHLMLDDSASSEDKLAALQAAAKHHQQLYMDAMAGKGVDRHLFALYIVSKGLGVDVPFLKAALGEPWRLSTSQQPQNQTGLWDPKSPADEHRISPGGGFGPVVDDGYGVSYMVASETQLYFHISSKKSSEATDSSRFRDHLFESLEQMKAILSITLDQGKKASK